MSEFIVKEESFKDFMVQVVYDADPVNPREMCDHAGTIVTWHRRYDLGDEKVTMNPQEWRDHALKEQYILLPIYMYDHSGITISVNGDKYPYNDRWDAGQVGWIYMTKEKAVKEWGNKLCTARVRKAARQCMIAEIEEYDKYLRGEVYGYQIADEKGEGDIKESCYGYYDADDCLAEGMSMAEWLWKQS